ncbi:MAG: hypothetical protein H7250_07080 [Flavobacterium sp.]|nr:hypothetical protein [Flavobacterium sp.]
MSILKNVFYIYIVLAILFFYDGIVRIVNNEPHPWLSFLIGAGAVLMFFFRRKYSKRFDDHYNKK